MNLQTCSRTAVASGQLCRQKSVASVTEHYHGQEATRGHKVMDGSRQAANLQCKGGEKKHKQQSLLSAIVRSGDSLCVSSVKLSVLHWAIMKPLCRKRNVGDRIKIADLPLLSREDM